MLQLPATKVQAFVSGVEDLDRLELAALRRYVAALRESLAHGAAVKPSPRPIALVNQAIRAASLDLASIEFQRTLLAAEFDLVAAQAA